MLDGLSEECGICAASCPGRNAAPELFRMIKDLQHRGQAGAGICTYNPARKIMIKKYKRPGRVDEVFSGADGDIFNQRMKDLEGEMGIGHTRYGTSGSLTSRHVQPFERTHGVRYKWFSFGFNGHIANRPQLEESILSKGYHLMLDTDTEVLMHYLSMHISDLGRADPKELFARIAGDFDGAFNISFLDAEGDLVMARDPWGIRPLSAVETPEGAFGASENCALHRFGEADVRHIRPGEMALFSEGGLQVERYCDAKNKALCFFEFLYFANVTSEIDGRPVYDTRKRCGEELAGIEDQRVNEKEWVIIPVPDTARPIAKSYARALGMSQIYDEGIIARGKGRTFIDEGDRAMKVMMKFLPIPSVLRGKKVVVIDDSIVRATTMATLVNYHLRRLGGAKEVHVRIATPPIIAPCYYGIDMRTYDELAASPYEDRVIDGALSPEVEGLLADRIGADSLRYQTHRGLIRALGFDRDEVCMACLNRKYPTPHGKILDEKTHDRFIRGPEEKPARGCGYVPGRP